MRLTERKVCYPRCDKQGKLTEVNYIEIKSKKLAEEKLCQLEDIEEEIGIDLITLFKILKQGFVFIPFFYNFDGTLSKATEVNLIGFNQHDIIYISPGGRWMSKSIKDYGKTWALTEEELL